MRVCAYWSICAFWVECCHITLLQGHQTDDHQLANLPQEMKCTIGKHLVNCVLSSNVSSNKFVSFLEPWDMLH